MLNDIFNSPPPRKKITETMNRKKEKRKENVSLMKSPS
jgi:hypothetical protein